MVETNPTDLLHELLAELLGAERVEIADIGPEELLSDHGMGSLRLIAAAQRLGSWETLFPRGSGVCTLDMIGTGEVEAGVGFTTGYRECDWEPLVTRRPGFRTKPAHTRRRSNCVVSCTRRSSRPTTCPTASRSTKQPSDGKES